jgi:hypothetical protein
VTPSSTREPIQIGVLVTDTDSFKAASGTGDSFTTYTRDTLSAFIKAVNADGGIAGRKLTVVQATFNYTAASYDTEFEAACQTFTRDHHVAAVIYDGVTYNASFHTCLTRAGVPVFVMAQGSTQIGDSVDLASYPGLVTAGSVSIDRRLGAIMTGSLERGFLRPGNTLGVIVETCPYHVRAYDRVLKPMADRNRISVLRTDVDCGAGGADHATGINAVAAAVLRYRTEGIDGMLFVTNYESGTWYYFATAAEKQGWRPQYLLWHNQGSAAYLAAGRDAGLSAQQVKARGFGSSPLSEVTHPPAPPPAQAAVRTACLATAKRQSVPVSNELQRDAVLDICDVVSLLRRALTLSGGVGGTRAIAGAVDRLGTQFVSAVTLNGATRFAPGRHDGPALGAVSVWNARCECIAYVTAPKPIP